MSDFMMTWEHFLKDASGFLEISEKFHDNWSLYKKNDVEGNSFLVYKQKVPFPRKADCPGTAVNAQKASCKHDKQIGDDQQPENVQVMLADAGSSKDLLQIEYHIVYSISYQVPVLYFQAHKSDGSILSLEDAWRLFRDFGNESLSGGEQPTTKSREEMLTILTQLEHPVLFRPYLALHPCRTSELLAQSSASNNHVLTFISLMGPYVRLQLRNEYGILCNE